MKIVLFGASGMIGQGLLREALLAPDVEKVLAVGRTPPGQTNPKLSELKHGDFLNFAPVEKELTGYDVCAWCLGVSSSGMSEADYTKVTFDYTMAAATTLLKVNPKMKMLFISGEGTDSTEKGRSMWARVKGKAENALLKMPFADAYMFRPGFIRPMHGVVSKTPSYRLMYKVMTPFFPIVTALLSGSSTNSEALGRAMLNAARRGADKKILRSPDINALAAAA